jgi:three-Cys-motif partner protein
LSQDCDDFFQKQKDWSKRKLSIVTSYLDSYSKILGSTTSQSCVYYVDGFAGKGTYDDGSKGSPILAAELAQIYFQNNKKYRLNCINVEENDENFANLEKVTASYSHIIKNINGSFSSNIDDILRCLGKCPALFFIDPFGIKDTDWEDLVKIIRRKAKTDLWMLFSHKTVRRLSGFFDSGSKGADSKVQSLLRFFGLQRTDNLFQALAGNTVEERIEKAVTYYVNRLETEFKNHSGFGFSASFPIVSLDGENKYYLVFAASHTKAAILASETVYLVERNRPKEVEDLKQRRTGQLLLFSSEPTEEEISKSIAEELVKDIWHLCAGRKWTKIEIYMELLIKHKKKWFGRFSSAHLNKALSLLESENIPKIMNRVGPISQDKTIIEFRSK